MAYLEWHYVLGIVICFCCWLYSSVKKFQRQINKRNNRVPDINVLKKIIPLSCNNGWKVKAVCNALPVWYYSTSFTFAPRNVVATRTVFQANSRRILEELKSVKVFSMIFPEFPNFQQKANKNEVEGDVLILSNIFASLALSNILLTGQQHVLTFERYWSSGPVMSWLYVTPTVQLLTSKYGYWFCFLLEDMENDSCLLHILASHPEGITSQIINQRISSCQVLIKDHIESLVREKSKPHTPDNDSGKVKSRLRTSSNPAHSSLGSSPSTPTPKSLNSSTEAIGYVEEPALIQHTRHPSQDLSKTPLSKGKPRNESPTPVHEKMNGNRNTFRQHDNAKKQTDEGVQIKQRQMEGAQNKQKQVEEDKNKQKQVEEAQNKQKQVEGAQNKEKLTNPRLEPYVDVVKEGFEKLMLIWDADEYTEGWSLFNKKDDVVIHRKGATAEEGGFGTDSYKGKTTIKVPLPYLINYIKDLQYRPEYDDMFESGNFVEELDDLTAVVCLVFKNVYFVTGRDFCSISAQRHLKDNLYGIMNKAVIHQDCPEKNKKVRGEIIIGGYIFEEVSKDPPVVNVMYAVCTNMNGSIPQNIVNKVLSGQPQSLAPVRKKVEERYRKRDPNVDGLEHFAKFHLISSMYPKEVIIDEPTVNEIEEEIQMETGPFTMVTEDIVVAEEESNLETEPTSPLNIPLENGNTSESTEDFNDKADNGTTNICESLQNESTKTADVHYADPNLTRVKPYEPSLATSSPTINSYTKDTMLSTGFDLKENHYSYSDDNLQLPKTAADRNSDEDIESLGETDSQFSEDGSDLNRQYSFVDHPRDSMGQIDYISLGNQSIVALEEEFFTARKVDTSIKHHESAQLNDVWMYRGTQKDVIIMRKTSSKQKIHSFLGRGIINVLPVTVWEMIKTPTTRFVYDSMLKKINTVKQIDKKSRIVYMRHETHACFVKQARDFCVMTVEAVKQQRYVIAAVSVDVPECPVTSDCVRGRVLASGWVIEPIVQNGKSAAMVTYISQVDFGGRLPTRLVNFISKRQPMAISYLRNYLEAAEH